MMRVLLKRVLPANLRYFVYKVGMYLARDLDAVVGSQTFMEWSLKNLKSLGYSPREIIDVGAYHGEWTELIKSIFPSARVLMVEAQPGKEAHLRKVKHQLGESVDFCLNLLGSVDGRSVVFNEMETGSSVFEEQSSASRQKVTYQTKTLDSIAKRVGFTETNLMKLDVQGYELEVLKGAAETMKTVDVVLMEVAFLPVNRGAPLINEVLNFMAKKDFVPYDICSLIRRPLDRALWQVDLIFVKRNFVLLQDHNYN